MASLYTNWRTALGRRFYQRVGAFAHPGGASESIEGLAVHGALERLEEDDREELR